MDTANFVNVAHYINNVWILPIQITGTVYMLYWAVVAAASAGLGVITVSSVAGFLLVRSPSTALTRCCSNEIAELRS